MRKKILKPLGITLLCAIWNFSNASENAQTDLDSFLDMDLEDLLTVEVTSVSKKKQRLTETAAAVFVISNEDIRRSGVTSIPEALRLAPGLQVAKLDNNTWAISSRGFNAEYANKLLVLIDGRSVYTPSFSGVYWDNQDTVLDDIDRIEVIRGPGATLWGANAVNGVINIITKRASETPGMLANLSVGNEEKAIAQLRYGTSLDSGIAARGYLKFADRDESYAPDTDSGANDDWQSRRAGFRLDGSKGTDSWTLQGDAYVNNLDQTIDEITTGSPDPDDSSGERVIAAIETNVDDAIKARGQNILGRWQRQVSPDSVTTLQMYYDHTDRSEAHIEQDIETIDIDFNHLYSGFQDQEIIWGLGYRHIEDEFNNTFAVSFMPASQAVDLYSFFIQDEISIEENLRLTMGAKVEHNEYTGYEFQPSLKALWLPEPGISLWSSLSRAVRTPSSVERRGKVNVGFFPGNPPLIASAASSGNFDSEKLLAFEIGFRIQPTEAMSFDLALFNNHYRDLGTITTVEEQPVPNPFNPSRPLFFVPSVTEYDNGLDAVSRGGELVFDWQVKTNWRTQITYSYIDTEITSESNSEGLVFVPIEEGAPEHYLTFRSFYDLSDKFSVDFWIYYVDELEATTELPTRAKVIDAYTSVNLRLSWQPATNLEISLVGQNLLDDKHREYIGQYLILPTEVERSVYGQIHIQF